MTPETTGVPPWQARAARLLSELGALRQAVAAEGDDRFRAWAPSVVRAPFRTSAHNLACYLALRHRDLRPLQAALRAYGLSSLGRLESRVLTHLDATLGALSAIAGAPVPAGAFVEPATYLAGEHRLEASSDELFGPTQRPRRVRLMVTLPSHAATEPDLLEGCLRAGADVVRINCAHDGPAAWTAMLEHLSRAEAKTGQSCRVLMDLAGPKPRIEAVLTAPGLGRIRTGDVLLLVRRQFRPLADWPAQLQTSLGDALEPVAAGAEIWFDDGKLATVVERPDGEDLVLRVTEAGANGYRMKPEKGVNLPGTRLALAPLTAKDQADLAFACAHADMIGYSFVQTGRDVALLQAELARHRPDDWQRLGLVAKIETALAVKNLPEIIVQAAGAQPFAVMIARGDLAVEIGFDRLAEMQEELLWLCEAAQVPVIWATQVLERLVKKGLPSRGEMTDAAMAGRAECVMLNKGPHLERALRILDHLLVRMAEHQQKKTSLLRQLHAW
ncbi:MAG: hypothetical protein EA356_07570 [Geminicoccaceae bacterium]|nr:MAG: hypothetical protein EA356_07570 [Geminicoccaceae bacterium]